LVVAVRANVSVGGANWVGVKVGSGVPVDVDSVIVDVSVVVKMAACFVEGALNMSTVKMSTKPIPIAIIGQGIFGGYILGMEDETSGGILPSLLRSISPTISKAGPDHPSRIPVLHISSSCSVLILSVL